MARFDAKKIAFGGGKIAESEENTPDDALPSPMLVRSATRRAQVIAEAQAVLEHLPADGESLHCLATARMDLTDVVNCLIQKLGKCQSLHIATLGYNARNLAQILGWLDAGLVESCTLLTSKFFRSYNAPLWEETQREFATRKQPCACCYSHAKVIALAFSLGRRMSLEGSANLCGNGSGREQFCLIADTGLYYFHAAWIGEMVAKHQGGES